MLNNGDFFFNDDDHYDGDNNDKGGGSVPGRSVRDQSLVLVPGTGWSLIGEGPFNSCFL